MNGGTLKDAEPIFRAVLESGGTFTLKPRGNSMRPTIIPGRDSVSIVTLEGQASVYDILLYQRQNGSFVLHRVAKVERDGTYTMCGDYQVVLERGIRQEDVIGVVTTIHQPQGDLVRGTKEFLAPAIRRARNRPLRRIRYYGGRLLGRLFGK
ncbi:MAG: S24/S26 family peptidase [Clostridia bacterium]|nr:S24/S26 family peptidase [Clostridia bacterium]